MLFLSRYPFRTLKTAPQISDNRSTGLLLQAGFIRQELAGAYIYTHMGLKVLRKIEQIAREELNAIGATEVLLTALGSKEHWLTTDRWDHVDVLFKLPASDNKEYALNPTHEEVVTPFMKEFIRSYRDLDHCSVYQFQTKFRNEARAKSGILRGREFLMKDMYSFHRNQEDLDTYFETVHAAYDRIFNRVGLGSSTHYTFASGGDFSKYSYEFQTELGIGEDSIFICRSCGQSHNEEILEKDGFVCCQCGHKECSTLKASEVGNIFKLGSRFSNAFEIKYADQNGKNQEVVMGCYGIGISRVMGVIAEKFMDGKGLVWPKETAPYTHCVIVIGDHREKALKLAAELEKQGGEVMIDDRDASFGDKAKDADLLGIPERIVLSDKTVASGGYETKNRLSEVSQIQPYRF